MEHEIKLEPLNMEEYQKKKCTWALNESKENDPHRHTSLPERVKIFNNITEAICWSPMVKLNTIPKSEGIKCELLAKCEFYLPGGSLKDRIGKRMIEDAEKKGLITPGVSTIIEATSGNTGIALALTGAVKGYNVIITLPEKMSQEKSDVLAALGSKIIRTPTEAFFADLDSHIGVARTLNKEIENSVILDQYCNPGNALAHYDETAEEIYAQCDGRLDYVIMCAGTGGTISGISRKLKEKNPAIKIIGVDPNGSILAYPDELNHEGIHSYKVEGIGYDFFPKNCDRTGNIDQWIKSNDKESFRMSRRLIREEGLLVGGSSGAAMVAALEIAKNLPEGKRVVCIFVDSVRNYMTKFLNDDWMLENEFYTQEEYDSKYFTKDVNIYGKDVLISELSFTETTPAANSTTKVKEVLERFENEKIECIPVIDNNGALIGLITQRALTNYLTSFKLNSDSAIAKAVNKEFKKLKMSDPVKYLSKAFNRHQYVIIEENEEKYFVCENKHLLNHYLKNNK